MNNLMLTMDASDYVCTNFSTVLKLVGYALMIFKIAIPLIIVILGLIDLGRAAISSKPEEIKKTMESLIWRIVGGIAVYILPGLIIGVFGIASGFNKATGQDGKKDGEGIQDWKVCTSCLNSGWSKPCTRVANCMEREEESDDISVKTCYDTCFSGNNIDDSICSKKE